MSPKPIGKNNDGREPVRRIRGARAALVAWGLLLLLPGTRSLPLIDRDEPRFAGATVEMIERGEWVVPYFNNEYRFDKPVLTYWLMRAGYAVFGVNELGARAHSIVSSLLLALALYGMGRWWFNERVGLFAAGGWLLTLQTLIHGRSAVADMPLVLCLAVTQFALYRLAFDEPRPRPFSRWFFIAYGAAGLGFLAKGPLALVVPLLTFLCYRWVFRRPVAWRALQAGWGLLLVLAILAPWGLPALIQTQGAFWQEGMQHHVINRGFQAFDGRHIIPFYYGPSSLISLFPWVAFVGYAGYAARRSWDHKRAFLVAWIAAPYLIFSLYKTQLPHYVMPAYPAYLLLVALAALETPPLARWPRRFAVALLGLVAAAGLGLLAAGAALPAASFAAGLRPVLASAGGLALGLTLCGLLFFRRRWTVGLAGLLLTLGSLQGLAVGLRAVTPAVELAPLMRAMPRDTRFLCCRFREPSLVFYSGRRWTVTGDPSDERVRRFFEEDGPALVVLTEEQWTLDAVFRDAYARARGRPGPSTGRSYAAENDTLVLPGAEVQYVEGFNVARSVWVRLRVLVRRAGASGGALAAPPSP